MILGNEPAPVDPAIGECEQPIRCAPVRPVEMIASEGERGIRPQHFYLRIAESQMPHGGGVVAIALQVTVEGRGPATQHRAP